MQFLSVHKLLTSGFFFFLISSVYITVSLIFIFSIIRTLAYPDYLLKSQRSPDIRGSTVFEINKT